MFPLIKNNLKLAPAISAKLKVPKVIVLPEPESAVETVPDPVIVKLCPRSIIKGINM